MHMQPWPETEDKKKRTLPRNLVWRTPKVDPKAFKRKIERMRRRTNGGEGFPISETRSRIEVGWVQIHPEGLGNNEEDRGDEADHTFGGPQVKRPDALLAFKRPLNVTDEVCDDKKRRTDLLS